MVKESPSPLSIAVAVVSGAVVALLIGYLTVLALQTDRPPLITARIIEREIEQRGEATYVPVEVSNEGTTAAAAVVVETARVDGEATATTTVDFLAGGETQRVYAVLPGPAPAEARVRVLGYQEP